MTTTDARKRRHEHDMADAHATARARDEARTVTFEVTPHFAGIGVALKAADRFAQARDAAWTLAALDGTGEPRTRTHSINPETGEFTPLDFHREWLHVMDTQRPHTPQETDMPNNQRRHREQMGVLDQIHDTLTEIRDRLPEREVERTRPEPGDVAEEPDEPMRTLPEAISGRIVIPHPSFSLEITSDGISPDLYAILTGSAMPPVEPAPADVGLTEPSVNVTEAPDLSTEDAGTSSEPAPADVDPLAEAIRVGVGKPSASDEEMWANAARVAREHIEAERMDAEAKRDQWKADVRDAAIARADRAEAERDALKAKADRYEALRADVESLREAWKIPSILSHAVPHLALDQALARDTERAES